MKFEWLLTENIDDLSGYATVNAGETILPDIENDFFYFDGENNPALLENRYVKALYSDESGDTPCGEERLKRKWIHRKH